MMRTVRSVRGLVLVVLVGTLTACTGSTSPLPTPAANSIPPAKLASFLVPGPSGWTAEVWFAQVTHHGDCISWRGARVTTSGWLTSREAGWRESATPAAPGTESIPSLGVCLSLFSSPAAAAKVQTQLESLVYTYDHPTGPTPSSVPSPVSVPGIRGAAGYFLDFSTSGEEQIFFAKGSVVVDVDLVCYGGGDDCGIASTMARREYSKLPG